MATPPNLEPTSQEMPPPEAPPEDTAILDQGQVLRRIIWFGLCVMTMLFISPATVMLMFFGLLPSFVALIIDRTDGKYATFCVLGLNFSGLFPFLSDVWFGNHSIDGGINVMTDVFSLLIIYGSAAFGWMLYMALPPVVTSFLSVMSQRRVGVLRENQAKIIEEWGESVTQALEAVPADELPLKP